MQQQELFLRFVGSSVELVEIDLNHPIAGSARRLVRGKTAGAFTTSHSFQWTSAVRGLAILLIRTKAWADQNGTNPQERSDPPVISGEGGSLAASLDYAHRSTGALDS